MKIKFKYINKKIIAGLMAGTMVLSFTGCGYDDKYKTNEKGEVNLIDSYNYDEVRNLYLLELKMGTAINLYIVREDEWESISSSNCYCYAVYDIFTNCRLGYMNTNNKFFAGPEKVELINVEQLDSYLISFNFLKDNYNKEDLEWLYNKIKENYEFKNNNQKIKE